MWRRTLVGMVLVMVVLGLAQTRQEEVLALEQVEPLTHVLLLLDVSGSMSTKVTGSVAKCTNAATYPGSRIAVACSAFSTRVKESAAGKGLLVYLRKKTPQYAYLRFGTAGCGVSDVLEVEKLNDLKKAVCKCEAIDNTPLAAALAKAKTWVNDPIRKNAKTIGVILVSDGLGNCDADAEGGLERAATALRAALKYKYDQLQALSFVSVLFIPPANSPPDPAVVEQLDYLARYLGARQVVLATSENEFSQGLLGALIGSVTPVPLEMGRLYATQELREGVLNVYLSDADGNGDGAADPGEQVTLSPQVVNLSDQVLEDVTIEMEVKPSSGVDPVTVTIDLGDIEPLSAVSSEQGATTTLSVGTQSGTTFNTRATVASAGHVLGTTTVTTAVGSVVSPPQLGELGIDVRMIPSAPTVFEDYQVAVETSYPNTYVEITIEGTDGFYCFDAGETDGEGVIVFPTEWSDCDSFGDGMIIGAEESGVRETVTVYVPDYDLWQSFTFTFEEEE